LIAGWKHAECVNCGAVLHAPWMASSPDMAVWGWSWRVRRGCEACGGRMRGLELLECAACEEVLSGAGVLSESLCRDDPTEEAEWP
jgi:hypothetical protein